MNRTDKLITLEFVPEEDEEQQHPSNDAEAMVTDSRSKAPTLRPEDYPWDDELDTHVRTDDDGTMFAWDPEKSAWFPVFRTELIDQQQSIYQTPATAQEPSSEAAAVKRGRWQKGNKQQQHSNQQQAQEQLPIVKVSQSSIYISGLPDDITPKELADYFTKCGLILPDPDTGKPKVKVYTDPQTAKCKGDGLITFFRPESVDLAITLLDETDIRPGFRIRVEKADFSKKQTELTAAATAAQVAAADHADRQTKQQQQLQSAMQRARKKMDRAKMDAQIRRLENQLDWADEDSVANEKWLRTVVLKYMFAPADIDADPGLLLDLKADIREECEKLGEVTTVTLFERHPDGVAVVRFKEQLSAQACVKLMNNRFFAGRQISASVQKSGLDEYQAANADTEETEEEEQRRLERFAQWLESGGTQQSTTTNVSLAAVEKSSNDEPAGHRDGGFLVPAAPLKAPKRLIDGKIKDLEQEESYFDAE